VPPTKSEIVFPIEMLFVTVSAPASSEIPFPVIP
jgi:hypothetical protein